MSKIYLLLFLSIFSFAKNILLLHSYSSTFDWTKEQSEIIMSTLKQHKNIKIFEEHMDTKVFNITNHYEKVLYQYYKNKYNDFNLDIVIATDDNALNFIIKYKNDLFPNSKIFFSGINDLSLAKTLNKNIYAGVFEEKDPLSNLQIAKTIDKELKTVYVISDNSITAKKESLQYTEQYKDIRNINFIYINDENIDTVFSKLKNYDKHSIMMLLVFSGFQQYNTHIDETKAVQELSLKYSNPMLIHTNIYSDIANTNIIGGNCTVGKISGEIVSKNVLEYLNGETLQNIGFTFKEKNRIYFNHKNLKKFNIKIRTLKKFNPIIIKDKNTFYELYYFYIYVFIIVSLIILLFTIMVMKKNSAINVLNNSLERKVQQALNQLENQYTEHQEEIIRNTKFSTIGQMAAGITHEINTPLTYLKGTNEMIQFDLEEMPDNKFKQSLLEDNQKMLNGINRIGMIVESMREMSQITPQKTENFNVYATIITMLRMSHNRSKLITKIYINDELFNFETSNKEKYVFMRKGHRQRLEQVWTIILNNALDELIKVENFDDRRINISISNVGKNIHVVICDNAGGIDDKIKKNIFEPFTSTKVSSGIGIGLNVAKKIIEEHRASIIVENKNEGACFTVIL